MRYNYGDPYLGTCKETVQGGNHFRYWIQNGKNANSGAIFMACSSELPVDRKHFLILSCVFLHFAIDLFPLRGP
jgi:hypothetical protein